MFLLIDSHLKDLKYLHIQKVFIQTQAKVGEGLMITVAQWVKWAVH